MSPEAVVEQGLNAIKTFLEDVLEAIANGAQVRSLQFLKVVLVGSASAGKTRYLFRFRLIVGSKSYRK